MPDRLARSRLVARALYSPLAPSPARCDAGLPRPPGGSRSGGNQDQIGTRGPPRLDCGLQAASELGVGQHLEPAVKMFHERGQGLDPVSGVQVVDVADPFVGRGMDVSADHPDAPAIPGQRLKAGSRSFR